MKKISPPYIFLIGSIALLVATSIFYTLVPVFNYFEGSHISYPPRASTAFTRLGFDYLIATMDKLNVNSQKVCDRLAFKLTEERKVDGKLILFYRLENTTANE